MDDGVSATRNFAAEPKKVNGRLLECLLFDILPPHLMFLLSALINVTLIFMNFAASCWLMFLKSVEFWQRLTKGIVVPSLLKKHFYLCLWLIAGLLSSLKVWFNPGQTLLSGLNEHVISSGNSSVVDIYHKQKGQVSHQGKCHWEQQPL